MKKQSSKRPMLFILVPAMVLSTFAFVLLPRTSGSINQNTDENAAVTQSNYDVNDRKHEAPASHEPVFVSIFKFIVNCNPFKKETQL